MRVSATMLGQLALSFLLACLIPSVLCPPPAYQHALPDSTDHAVQPEVRLDVIEPEKFSSPYTSKASPRQPPPSPAKPTINITAIFEEEDMDDFVPEFERALRDIVGHNNSLFSWSGKALVAYRDVKKMVSMLCAHFQGDRSHVRLIIVFGRNATIQTINIVSEALGIPVLGYVIQRGDGYMQVNRHVFGS
ncbi:glutamate receptor ionotropic, NMDA 3A isoform X2 [Biomphalaria glabrata]|nr:glutamate receptor ionotropic, NMDA 3A isoform X2 [Biomphalaria glabrata]